MVGDEHADAAVAEPADEPLQLADRDRVDAREGLVEEDVPRRREEAPRHLRPPPLAAGELLAERLGDLLEPELGEERARPLLPLLLRHAERLEDADEVLPHREAPEDGGLLREVADAEPGPAVHRERGEVHVTEEHAPLLRDDEPHHHVERGGLPRAVRAEEPDHLTGRHVEGDVVHDPPAAVGLHEPLRAEEAGGVARGAHFFFSFRRSSMAFCRSSISAPGRVMTAPSSFASSDLKS